MTIDDEKSVYVGGLPYDASEETVRRAFDLYGAVREVRVRNLAPCTFASFLGQLSLLCLLCFLLISIILYRG